jgi:hypothetical protein
MPHFPMWIKSSITIAIKKGETIEKDVVHISMPPIETKSYQTMWALVITFMFQVLKND